MKLLLAGGLTFELPDGRTFTVAAPIGQVPKCFAIDTENPNPSSRLKTTCEVGKPIALSSIFKYRKDHYSEVFSTEATRQ